MNEQIKLQLFGSFTIKKGDTQKVLSKAKILDTLFDCEENTGDVYDKAVCLLKGLSMQEQCKGYGKIFIQMKKSRSGSKMDKSENLNDKKRCEIVIEELGHFEKLIKGHEKLLVAIGEL